VVWVRAARNGVDLEHYRQVSASFLPQMALKN